MVSRNCILFSSSITFLLLSSTRVCNSFVVLEHRRRRSTTGSLDANNNKKDWNQDIDRRASQSIERPSGGETMAGAVLGGLLLGPFGAVFGASVGNSFGQQRSVDRARQKAMEDMGMTPEMLESAQEIGVTLENSMQGLQAIQDSLRTQQNLARRLEEQDQTLYGKAQEAVTAGDEDSARKYLLERTQVQDKLVKTLKSCAEERKRLEQMEGNVQALEERAQEMERLLSRAVGAKALQDSSNNLRLNDADPLLQKFRDAGID